MNNKMHLSQQEVPQCESRLSLCLTLQESFARCAFDFPALILILPVFGE